MCAYDFSEKSFSSVAKVVGFPCLVWFWICFLILFIVLVFLP